MLLDRLASEVVAPPNLIHLLQEIFKNKNRGHSTKDKVYPDTRVVPPTSIKPFHRSIPLSSYPK